eukprot:TRINITY_DN7841_c3_g1_i1.p1 TRINITY_DN7841_c3_g1~~TRINITY_DN7841_c3_g1_i1.p1  ORF type:complete len:139 (+),score=16.61 TRINITY_DN7841_c3_g1_i1:43-417(+)
MYERGHDTEIVFRGNGDFVKLRAAKEGVLELVGDGKGEWIIRGVATEFTFDPKTRILRDQLGKGGTLPEEGLDKLLQAIQSIAETARVPHNIRIQKMDNFIPFPEPDAPSAGSPRMKAASRARY